MQCLFNFWEEYVSRSNTTSSGNTLPKSWRECNPCYLILVYTRTTAIIATLQVLHRKLFIPHLSESLLSDNLLFAFYHLHSFSMNFLGYLLSSVELNNHFSQHRHCSFFLQNMIFNKHVAELIFLWCRYMHRSDTRKFWEQLGIWFLRYYLLKLKGSWHHKLIFWFF